MAVRRFVACVLVFAVLASGCGGSSETVEEAESTSRKVEPTSPPELSSTSEPSTEEEPVVDRVDEDSELAAADEVAAVEDSTSVISKSSEVHLRTGQGSASAIARLLDGMVASAGLSDGTVQIWDPADPDRPAVAVFDWAFTGSASAVGELADGRLVVSGLSARIAIVDRADPSAVPEYYVGHRVPVASLTVLDDGHVVSVAGDVAHRWHPDDPLVTVTTYNGFGLNMSAVAAFGDGRIATNRPRSDEVTVWSSDGAIENVFECGCGTVASLASTSGGGVVAAGTSGVVVVDADDGIGPPQFVAAFVNPQLAVFDDGRIAIANGYGQFETAASDDVVHVWDPGAGDNETEQFVVNSRVHAIAVSASQDLIVGTNDGVYVIGLNDQAVPYGRYGGHEAATYDIVELSDGRIVAGLGNGTVGIWDRSASGMPETTYVGHSSAVHHVALLADGLIASATFDGEIQVWHPDDPTVTISSHTAEAVTALAVTGDGALLVATGSVVEVRDGNNLDTATSTFTGHSAQVGDVIALSDGRVVSAGSDQTVQVWDPNSGVASVVYTGHSAPYVSAVSQLSGGRIASGTLRGPIHVWHPGDPSATLATFQGLGAGVFAIRELPGGRIASAGGSNLVHVWETGQTTADQAVSYNGHRLRVHSLVVLSNGDVASGAPDGIRIWDSDRLGN